MWGKIERTDMRADEKIKEEEGRVEGGEEESGRGAGGGGKKGTFASQLMEQVRRKTRTL